MAISAREKCELWESATTQDIMENPDKFGAPTFDMFKSHRDKYIENHNQNFGRIEQGGAVANRYTKKQIYEIEGYRCKTLEEVERVANSMGINLKKMKYTAEFLPLGGGQADVLVKFMSESLRNMRDSHGF